MGLRAPLLISKALLGRYGSSLVASIQTLTQVRFSPLAQIKTLVTQHESKKSFKIPSLGMVALTSPVHPALNHSLQTIGLIRAIIRG